MYSDKVASEDGDAVRRGRELPLTQQGSWKRLVAMERANGNLPGAIQKLNDVRQCTARVARNVDSTWSSTSRTQMRGCSWGTCTWR